MGVLKGHNFSGWPKLNHRGKEALAVALAALAIYTGFRFYGGQRQEQGFGPDKLKSQFYMKEVQRAKPPAEQIRK